MSSKIAFKTKDLPDWSYRAAVYRLIPPILTDDGYSNFVVVSASRDSSFSDVLVLPSDEEGNVANYLLIVGSHCGLTDHKAVLAKSGYALLD